MKTACPEALCSHSISTRLSRKLAIFTMVVLGVLFAVTWGMVKMILVERNKADLAARCELITDVVSRAAIGGETAVMAQLLSDAPMRASTRLQVWRADGSKLYADYESESLKRSEHTVVHEFSIPTPTLAGGEVRARYTVDYSRDAEMGTRWAWILVGVTLAAGALVATGTRWHVKRGLSPLRDLAAQTRAISARDLDRRLQAVRQPERPVPLGRQEHRQAAGLQPPELVVVVQRLELLLDRPYLPLVATGFRELLDGRIAQVLQGDAVGLGLLRQGRGRQVDRDAGLAPRLGQPADLGKGRYVDMQHRSCTSSGFNRRVA